MVRDTWSPHHGLYLCHKMIIHEIGDQLQAGTACGTDRQTEGQTEWNQYTPHNFVELVYKYKDKTNLSAFSTFPIYMHYFFFIESRQNFNDEPLELHTLKCEQSWNICNFTWKSAKRKFGNIWVEQAAMVYNKTLYIKLWQSAYNQYKNNYNKCTTLVLRCRNYGTLDMINIGSGNIFLPDGNKPLPKLMLIYHKQEPLVWTLTLLMIEMEYSSLFGQ